MYGINPQIRKITQQKMRDTKFYMDNNFVKFGDEVMPYSHFFKNAFINPHRYIAEIQNRVWSIYNYAQGKDLVPLFFTLSAPSEHHPKRKIFKKGKFTGKVVRNYNYNLENTPKKTAKYLSACMRKITNDRTWRKIPKSHRCYFRVFEPHHDGTPHVHVMFFVPKENLFQLTCKIHDLFPAPQGELVVNVESPVHYLMKYVYKTLDDLRYGEDNISDLTLWYIYHGICRIYTSRTLISLDVYRVLGGRFSLNELTLMYKEKRLTIYVDPFSNKPTQIFDEFGQIWNKKIPIDINFNHMRHEAKPKLLPKKQTFTVIYEDTEYLYKNGKLYDVDQIPIIPSKMKDYQLFDYFLTQDPETCDNYIHYGITQNECIKRGLIQGEIQSLNCFNTNFNAIGA